MSDDRTCSTCQWWKAYTSPDAWEWPELRDEHGDTVYDENYLTTPAPGTWGECLKAAEFGPSQSDRFYVVDGSEYKAELHTRGDFGCIEWAAARDALKERTQ